MSNKATLANSREFLTNINQEVLAGDELRYSQLIWDKGLREDNPAWKYIKYKMFVVDGSIGKAHVLAMIDKRLPNIGLVGYFATNSIDAGVRVLKMACKYLKKEGLTRVYGPIDGTIINNYRLNLDPEYYFPGEPINPKMYLETFSKADFEEHNRYHTGETSVRNVKFMNLFMKPPLNKYPKARIRSFDPNNFDNDFTLMIDLFNQIFAQLSIYCTKYTDEEFRHIFEDQRHLFTSEHAKFLLDGEKAIGAILSYPYKDSLIIKTVGVLPKYQGTGLSKMLISSIHDAAHEGGLKKIIYALVRQGNSIDKMKRPGVKITRNYMTMVKEI